MTSRIDPRSVIYTPSDVATLGQQYLGFRREHAEAGVVFPVRSVADRFYPLLPGEVMSIIARPGHAKTGLMMAWARQRARWLKENGFDKRIVVYATWEQSIEELHAFHVAAEKRLSITNMAKGKITDEEWEQALSASTQRIDLPLWFIGHSVMRKTGRAPITVDVLAEAMEQIQGWGEGYVVDTVFTDYLQRISPSLSMENPVVAYSNIMDRIKNTALGFGAPFVVGVQASRDVDSLSLPIPEIQHAQWTSNVEQTSDRVISLVRPRRYRKEGEKFGSRTVEGYQQLLISVLKQKLGEANFAEWTRFDPVYNKLDELEEYNENLNRL